MRLEQERWEAIRDEERFRRILALVGFPVG